MFFAEGCVGVGVLEARGSVRPPIQARRLQALLLGPPLCAAFALCLGANSEIRASGAGGPAMTV